MDAAQAIEMLAQHIITRPVFDALFSDYQFVNNNTVSRSMQRMIDLLQEQALKRYRGAGKILLFGKDQCGRY